MSLNELDEAASLAWGDLDVGNLTKALEEGAELVLGNVSREAANEDGRVVRVGELVHGLRGTIVAAAATAAHGGRAHRVHAERTPALRHAHAARPARATTLVLGSRGGDAHRAIAAVHALHFAQRVLLVLFAAEAHETITARHSADGVGHDLGGLAGRILVLEQGDKDELSDLGTKITDEDGEFGSAVIAAMRD